MRVHFQRGLSKNSYTECEWHHPRAWSPEKIKAEGGQVPSEHQHSPLSPSSREHSETNHFMVLPLPLLTTMDCTLEL